jgi:hypothetical protein
MHAFASDALADMLRWAGVTPEPDAMRRALLMQTHLKLAKFKGRDSSKFDACVRALYQKSVVVAGRRVFLDGAATPDEIAAVFKELGVDAKLSAEDVFSCAVSESPDVPMAMMPEACREWDGISEVGRVPILPSTCRPPFKIKGKTWKEVAAQRFDVDRVGFLVPLTRYFAWYVLKNNAWPTRDQLVAYAYERTVRRCFGGRTHTTLPAYILREADECLLDYEHVAALVTTEEFVRRWKASEKIEDRVAIEKD